MLASEVHGEGRDLVMLHGWGMSSAVWSEFAQELAASYRVTQIDLPGHGHSPYNGQRSLYDWAADCLAAAPPRAVWLGWSLGGMVALQAAQLAPESVTGVIVVAGTPCFVQALDWPHAMAPRTLDLFRQALDEDHTNTLERFLSLQMLGSDQSRETLRTLKVRLQERPQPHPGALERGLELLKSTDLRTALAELVCPTAWVYGGRDTLVPSVASKSLRGLLRQAPIEIIPGAAHTPFLSHPARTLLVVNQFLEQFNAV